MSAKLHREPRAWLRFLCLMTVPWVAAVGCNGCTVKKPSSDSTPPSLVWNVFNHNTSEQADHPGSPTLNAKRGERYRVILKANDPEGVNWIKINPAVGDGEMAWQCRTSSNGENLAQNKDALLGPQSQNLSPDANGNVLTSIILIYELDFTMECQPGWNFNGGTAKLKGQASNYFGGVTTEVITFKVSP